MRTAKLKAKVNQQKNNIYQPLPTTMHTGELRNVKKEAVLHVVGP